MGKLRIKIQHYADGDYEILYKNHWYTCYKPIKCHETVFTVSWWIRVLKPLKEAEEFAKQFKTIHDVKRFINNEKAKQKDKNNSYLKEKQIL